MTRRSEGPGLRPALGALLIAALLAGCGGGADIILQGEREPLRAEGDRFVAPEAGPNESRPIRLGTQQANANWTHVGGSPAHVAAHPALPQTLSLVWSAGIGEGDSRRHRITAAPIVATGRVFTLDAQARVAATATSGASLWSRDLTPAGDRSGDASGGALAYADGTLFVNSAFGILSALDAETGAVLWQQDLDAAGSGAPTVVDGIVYVVSRDNRGWALNTDNGRVLWTIASAPSPSGIMGGAAPAVAGNQVVFPFSTGELISAFRRAGLQRWRAAVAGQRRGFAISSIGDITGDPVITGNRVYAANHAGRLAALNLASGERLWTAREGALGPVVPVDGSLFLISDRNELLRLDAGTGARIWGVELPFFVKDRPRRQKEIYAHHGPLLAGGRIWVASNDGLLRGFDPVSGAQTASVEVPGGASTAPVVAGGTLYVVSTRGKLHAFR